MAAAVALFLLGAAAVFFSLQLPLGTLRAAGSGLFPLALGVLLMGLSACHAAQLLLASRSAAGAAGERPESYRRVLLFLGVVAATTALLTSVGFLLSAFCFLLALMEILGVRPRLMSLLVSLVTAGFSYLLFVRWLQIPLPKGWLGL
ncbi:MAG: tripartite tricarboxylate transporter TctB family protein [Candidatus Methylomirabilota bacterium]